MPRTITLGAAQTGPVNEDDWRPNVPGACAMIEEAGRRKVDILCFAELFLTPFFPNRLTRDYAKFFVTLDEPGLAPIFKAAVDNRVALLPSDLPGGTGSYEKFYFSPGNEFPVFDLCGTKIGIQICYDRKYPEGSRLLALKGAEILFMPICAATYGETKLRGNTWELPLQARAYENGVYVVAVNRCGMEHGRNHIGRSMIVDPIGADMLAVASSDTPEVLVATVDLDNVAAAQTSLPWWRDRRPELYGSPSTA